MARLEALITMGQRPQHVSFSPVKVPVTRGPPAGSLSQAPFMLSAVPSDQAGPSPVRIELVLQLLLPLWECLPLWKNFTRNQMWTLPNRYFHSPYGDSLSHSLPVSSASYLPPDLVEEGELSDPEDQPQLETRDSDRVISEEQN